MEKTEKVPHTQVFEKKDHKMHGVNEIDFRNDSWMNKIIQK